LDLSEDLDTSLNKKCLFVWRCVLGEYSVRVVALIEEGTQQREMDLFSCARNNEVDAIHRILQDGANPNDRDGFGRTSLHICSTYGSSESAAVLLKWKADHTLQDYENGWTPLHRSLYFGHLKVTLLLLKAGAKLTCPPNECSERRERNLKNVSSWISPLDHEGNSPLALLSLIHLKRCRHFSGPLVGTAPLPSSQMKPSSQFCSELLTFGKADFYLGVPLPRSSLNVSKPRPILDLQMAHVVGVTASKYHSAALTSDGHVYTWGIGKGGRLGHGHELNLPSPTLLQSLSGS
jgi:inhibitor of Bruton tyrosine kinase